MALFFSDSVKILCAFHQNQHITNFCTCQNCLLPLCPLCIKIHTSQHISMHINPQYEHISQIISDIESDVTNHIAQCNTNYNRILDISNKFQECRTSMMRKISALKYDMTKQIEEYFIKLEQSVDKNINAMNYVKSLSQYRQAIKKNISFLKSINRNLSSPDKVMRAVIKYKAQNLTSFVSKFTNQANDFINKWDHNIINFTTREDYKTLTHNFLNSIREISLEDINHYVPIFNLSDKFKECIQKNEEKKQIRQSIEKILGRSSLNSLNNSKDLDDEKPSRSSLADLSCLQIAEGRKRSISKGKGLTVMQQMSNILTTGAKKIPRISRIVSGSNGIQNSFDGWGNESKSTKPIIQQRKILR